MEAARSSVNYDGKGKKSKKTRRTWSVKEEEALIEALKTAVGKGLKSENGFCCGYLSFLEDELKKTCPDGNIRANPHIHSKIHVWKKTHGSLVSMLSRSGIGWNDIDKMIEATNEAWEAYAKTIMHVSYETSLGHIFMIGARSLKTTGQQGNMLWLLQLP